MPEPTPGVPACESSAGGGSYVCSKARGHDGYHVCRSFGRADGDLWASWLDDDADDEPMWCAHEETEDVDQDLHRCTRCGSVRLQIDDPKGTTIITTLHPRSDRRVRYECAICGVGGCFGCPPPPVLRGWAPLSSDDSKGASDAGV